MTYMKLIHQINQSIINGHFNDAMSIAHDILDGYEKKLEGYQLLDVFSNFERFYLNVPNSIMYITYMRRLKKLFEKEGRIIELVDTMCTLVNDYVSIGDADLAYITCAEAMVIAKKHQYHIGECNLLNGYGNIYDILENYDESLSHYENAYLLSNSVHYIKGKRFAHNLGYTYKKLKDYEQAVVYLKIAYDNNYTIDKEGIIANTCNEYGDALICIEDYELAEEVLLEAQNLCIQSMSNYFLKENQMILSKLYEATNRPADALKCYKKYHELDQTINKIQQEAALKEFTYKSRIKNTLNEKETIDIRNKELEAYSKELHEKNAELHLLLTELREYKESITTLEKQSSFNRMLIGISHHINTSLGNSLLSISYLQDSTNQLELALSNRKLSKTLLIKYIETTKVNLGMMMNSYNSVNNFIEKIKDTPISIDELKKSNPLQNIIQNCMKTHQLEIANSQISFVTKLEDPIPQLKGTKVFEEICNQLMSNALKYAFDDQLDSTITIAANLDEFNNLNIEFIDNGSGIHEDKIAHIFDPFYTSEMGLSGGHGLGLYFVSKTVYDVLGGSIKCISEYGEGTQFVIKLPNNGVSFTKLSH